MSKRRHGLLAPTVVACLRTRTAPLWFKQDPQWKFCPLCGGPLPKELAPVPKALPERFTGWRSAVEAVHRIQLCQTVFDYPGPDPQAIAVACTGEQGHPGAHRALIWEADHEPQPDLDGGRQ